MIHLKKYHHFFTVKYSRCSVKSHAASVYCQNINRCEKYYKKYRKLNSPAIALGILDVATVENIKAFPNVYRNPNWTLWHQLKRFFGYYTWDADATDVVDWQHAAVLGATGVASENQTAAVHVVNPLRERPLQSVPR